MILGIFPLTPMISHGIPNPVVRLTCACFFPCAAGVLFRFGFAFIMAIFLSTFVNKLDKKGRVSVPATYRAVLSGLSFQGIIAYRSYVSQAVEACGVDVMERMVASVDDFDLFSEERAALTSTIFADCEQLSFDPEGRIMLPESLLAHAGIQERVAFVGCGSTFQMWEPEIFQAYQVSARERLKGQGLTLGLANRRPAAGGSL